MSLPADVTAWIDLHFAPLERAPARQLLESAVDHARRQPDERLLRCAAVASRGDLPLLREYVRLLAVDYRDVIVAGEYRVVEGRLVRVFDFSRPLAAADS